MMSRLLTPSDVAERLQCSRSYAYEVMRKMKHVLVGRLVRVSEAEFERYLAKRTDDAWSDAPVPKSNATRKRAPASTSSGPTSRPSADEWVSRHTQPRTTGSSASLIRPIKPRTKPLAVKP